MIRKFTNKNINILLNFILLFGMFSLSIFLPINTEITRKIFTFLFFLLIFTLDYKKMYFTYKDDKLVRAILVFFIFSIVSYFWTENIDELKRIIRNFFRYWIVPTIVLISIAEKKHIKYLISAFLLGMLINGIFSALMYFYDLKEFFSFKFSPYFLVPYQSSHMEYSVYIALTAIIFVYYFIISKEIKIKLLFLFLSSAFIILLFMLSGRTGQIAFIFSSIILILIYNRNIKRIVLSILSLILLVFLAYSTSINFKNRVDVAISNVKKVHTDNDFSTSAGVRISAYYKIPEVINSINIIYGTGWGDLENTGRIINNKLFGNRLDEQLGRMHESFISIFAGLGLVGLFIFLYIFYKLFELKIMNKDLNFIRYTFSFCIISSLLFMDFYNQREIVLLIAFISSLVIIYSKDLISTKK
jgi:O-antigen ligase